MTMRADSVIALRAGEDTRGAVLRLGRAHERFISSHTMPSCVRPVVARSWQRCAVAGVSCDGHRLPARRLRDGGLEDYRSGHPLAVLMPLFGELLGERADDGEYIYGITDAGGTLLWVQGHHGTLRRAERMNFAERGLGRGGSGDQRAGHRAGG
jgi:transcriptional regulator of acetoin/glycerol metabolism